MQEIFEETDGGHQGAGRLDLLRLQAAQFQMAATGMMPDGTPLMMADGSTASGPVDPAWPRRSWTGPSQLCRSRRWTTTTVGPDDRPQHVCCGHHGRATP